MPQRRSARLAAAAVPVAADPPIVSKIVSKKRRKTAASRTSRPSKALARPAEIPLDVCFEIFHYLGPPDLLSLARATKPLRRSLMRRAAQPIWAQSFRNLPGVPGCPPDLTEPQYAELIFGRSCQFCGARTSRAVLWACRVRSCSRCFDRRLISASRCPTALRPCLANDMVVRRCKETEKAYVLKADLARVHAEFQKRRDDRAGWAAFSRAQQLSIRMERHWHAYDCRRWLVASGRTPGTGA